jgi:hypothetical protein
LKNWKLLKNIVIAEFSVNLNINKNDFFYLKILIVMLVILICPQRMRNNLLLGLKIVKARHDNVFFLIKITPFREKQLISKYNEFLFYSLFFKHLVNSGTNT